MVVKAYRSSNYLEHHGILKQKWGVRHGPPYPLKYDDYSKEQKQANPKSVLGDRDNKSETFNKSDDKTTLRDKRKAQLISKGFSEKQALSLIKFENRAALVTAVAAAAVGATVVYGLVHQNDMNSDFILKAGEDMFRVASSDSSEMRDIFYASTNKFDAKKYAGTYARSKLEEAYQKKIVDKTAIYEKVLVSKKDVKIAGAETCKQLFEDLKKNDPDFKKEWNGSDYEEFNILINGNNVNYKKFFNLLESKGYGGLIDVNDVKISGYHSNRPVVLFNQQSNISAKSVRELPSSEIYSNDKWAQRVMLAQEFLEDSKGTFGTIGVYSGLAYLAVGKKYLTENGLLKTDNKNDDKKK